MWECHYCKESIKDKYKHCWNCGRPKPLNPDVLPEEPVIPKTVINPPPAESPVNAEISEQVISDKGEIPSISHQSSDDQEFLSGYESSATEETNSKVKQTISVCLWLLAFGATIVFAYLSWQKMDNFEKNLGEAAENFNNQKGQFIFPRNIPRVKGDKTPIGGNIIGKVLPLNAQSNTVETLFFNLPDDLRPVNLEEAKTLMWIDCQNEVVDKYADGSRGLQEKCKVYLVERETGKFIGIQDFLGMMPALSKEKEGKDAIGKVLPDKFISFLREKQSEGERTSLQTASDSPDHHFFSKSEFYYAVFGLGIIIAVGLGWLVFKLKSNRPAQNYY